MRLDLGSAATWVRIIPAVKAIHIEQDSIYAARFAHKIGAADNVVLHGKPSARTGTCDSHLTGGAG